MRYRSLLYAYCLIFFCCFAAAKSKAQSVNSNACGVVASIWPAVNDSVVPVNTNIPFTSTSTNATSFEWLYDGTFSGITGPTWNYNVGTGVHTISLVAINGACRDTITVVYFSAGTAHNVDSLLIAQYGSYMYNEEGTCVEGTADGGYIMGGVQYPFSCGETGILTKLREKGCIDWSKKILTPYNCTSSAVTALLASADTTYYAVMENLTLSKFDRNGNILWNHLININNQGSISLPLLAGDPSGAVYSTSVGGNNAWTITKLDNSGNLVWNKFLRLSYELPGGPGQSEFAIPSGMVWLNDKIYVCGNAYSSANSTYFSFITRLDAVSGTKEWQYGYVDPNYPGAVGFVHLALYDTLLLASSAAQGQIVTLIDQQGNVRKNIKTQFTASNYAPKVTRAGADSNGHIYMMEWVQQTLPLQPYYQYYTNFAEIDTSLNRYWGMVFSNYSRPYFADATIGPDNKFGAVGTNFGYVDDGLYASRDMRFLRVDTVTAQQFCYDNGINYSIATEPINRINFQYGIDSSLSITIANGLPFYTTDAFMQSRYTCPDYIDSCSFMRITGPVSMCSLADTYTYRMHRNKRCTLVPQWQLPPGATIVNQTDSTLSLKFSTFGTYRLYASLQSCIPVKDSLIIQVNSRSHILNIGNDTSLCSGTSITLHAGNNFLAYSWNNSSTDSVLTVMQPGIYWVETIDSCNNILRDSITIDPYNQVINAGPDRTKCNNDTVHINAPSGFLNYTWSNNYYINSTSSQNIIVNPPVDTVYYLKAEKLTGCFAYDTIRVQVQSSPPIQLGVDRSFCFGDSAILNAGAGFLLYQWSNGSLGQFTTVKTTGNYWVTGTAFNGCKSYDTLRILNVWPNPVINLGHNPDLCVGSVRILQPGNYASYIWQDGSSAATYAAASTGTYYVTVTDNNGCKGMDTVRIINLLPAPADFLFSDTASICSYGELKLTATQTFSSYLWSNGQNSPSVVINQPGLYWLQVTNNNNCPGKDSIRISLKDCMHGIYVPTAFSPNGDQTNDTFRPMLFGTIISFEWIIYDRYGNMVFRSADPGKGWNGNIKGMKQDTGVFVWTCKYQFANETMQVRSGTVLLLH